MNTVKASVIKVLDVLVRNAAYNNWGNRKDTDPKNVVGFLNFKASVYINGKKECVRIAVRMTKEGIGYVYPYYSVEVNKKRKQATR
ncbi:MAG: hypothetical protein LBG17_05270 [Bacteroidales bacterium]|jgi:hypothetical protein|nr:hypothetical protein [Bacteroidales bacterium]